MAARGAERAATAVGISDAELCSAPHAGQKRAAPGTFAPQRGQ